MHIPDGFLDVKVWVPLAAVSAGTVAYCSRKVNNKLDDRLMPLTGVLAAFVFAAQMVNFPVGGGTSGHLMGGVLSSFLLGPATAIVIMAAILILQALLFQDGGVTALGANIFNMGIVAAGLGYLVFRILHTITGRVTVSLFCAAWLSIVMSACAAAVQLSVSGVAPLSMTLPAMAAVHAVIGIGEGAITVAAIELIRRSGMRSETVNVAVASSKTRWLLLGGSLLVAAVIAPFASSLPDGMERVAEKLGFADKGKNLLESPIPDYEIPGIVGGMSTSAAGLAGVLVLIAVSVLLVMLFRGKRW